MTTLGQYRDIALALGGEKNNLAVAFIEAKIAKQGANTEVLADESQMMMVIASLLHLPAEDKNAT
jgi:hypothetical protein